LSPLNLKVFSHQKLTLDEILLTIKQLHYTYTWETYHKWEVVVVAFCLYNVFAVARSWISSFSQVNHHLKIVLKMKKTKH